MNVKNIKKLFSFFGIGCSLPLMLIPADNTCMKMVGFVLLVMCQLYAVEFDLAHPFVWFLSIFLLYTVSAPLLMEMRLLDYRPMYDKALCLHYIAAAVFILVVGTRRYRFRLRESPFNKNSLGIKTVFLFGLLVSFLYIIFLYKVGITNKCERALSYNPMAFLGFGFYILTTAMSMLLLHNKLTIGKFLIIKKLTRRIKIIIVFFVCFFLLGVFFTGERHSLFRAVLVVLVIYHTLVRPFKAYQLVLLLIISIVVSAILNQFKMCFLSNNITYSMERVPLEILYGEFKSASRNLAILLNYVPSVYPYSHGSMFLSDVLRAFLPGFLLPHFEHSALWFNKTFFPSAHERGLGLGFTLVGAGYVNFGVLGVVLLFAIIGLTVRYLYRKSSTSPIFYLIYINLIPIVGFSFRGDISTLLSSTWKHVVLMILIALFIDRVLFKTLCRNRALF